MTENGNEAAGSPATPAGWYPDSSMPGTQRYWDGSAWTQHVAPMSAPIQAPGTRQEVASGFAQGTVAVIAGIALIVVIVLVLAYWSGSL